MVIVIFLCFGWGVEHNHCFVWFFEGFLVVKNLQCFFSDEIVSLFNLRVLVRVVVCRCCILVVS